MEKFIDWLNKKCCYDSDEDVENEKASKQTPSSIEEPRGHSIERGSHTVNVSNQNINKGTDSFQARGSRSSSDIHEKYRPSKCEQLNSPDTEYARLQDEINKLDSDYRRSENKREQLQRKLSSLEENHITEIEKLKNSYRLIESENKTLQQELNKLSKLEQNQITEIERLERSCKQIEKKYQEVWHNYSELIRKEKIIPGSNTVNASNQSINCETDPFQALGSRSSSANDIHARNGRSRCDRLYKQLSEKQHARIEQKKKIDEDKEHEIKELKDEKDSLLKLIQDNENKYDRNFKAHKRQWDSQMSELKVKLESALTALDEKERLMNKLRAQNAAKLNEMKNTNEDNINAIEKLKEQIESMKNLLLSKETEIDNLKQGHETLQSQHSELLACIKQKEHKQVQFPIQIYCAGDTEISLIASELFSEVLQSHMSDLPVHIQQYRNAADIKPNLPTVCLCVHVSRLGTDVMNRMKELEINSNVVVVVLHFKEPHCLPSESSRRILTEKEYKHGLHAGMYDLGFQKHSIYDCPQNNAHWGDIIECLKNILYKSNMITDQ